MAYEKKVSVQCPDCKKWRRVKPVTKTIIKLNATKGIPTSCKACGHKKYSKKTQAFYKKRDKKTKEIKRIVINGCRLVPAEGRSSQCRTIDWECKNYDACLTEVAKTHWHGWKPVRLQPINN